MGVAEEIAREYDDTVSLEGKRERERERYRAREEGRREGDATFSVVLQPFFAHSKVPLKGDGTPDVSLFSVDCFHFNVLGHEVSLTLQKLLSKTSPYLFGYCFSLPFHPLLHYFCFAIFLNLIL